MSIIRKVFTILLAVTLMFMNISGVKAQDNNTTTDFSNYITAASLDYKEGDKEIAYATDTKLTEDTNLIFKLDADVPSSALSSDHKIDYQLPDNLNVDDTTSDHIYLKDDLNKSVGNYTIADHHMVIDLSALDYGVYSSKSIELDLETTTSHLIFTDSEAKIYFRKATNESPTEVMVSVLQSYANDTKADPNSIIKNTNTDTNTKKSSKQVITMSGVKRANSSVKARAGVIHEISDTINDKAKDGGLSGEYRLTGTTRLDQSMSGANAGVLIKNDVTIDLNGHKLQLYNGLYFDVQSGGHLTIIDSKADQYRAKEIGTTKDIGNPSALTPQTQADDNRNVPSSLDYYVTSATPTASKTGTTDTTKKYHVDFSSAGRIYSETNSTPGQDSTFLIEKGGTLDFKSGVAYNIGPHVVSTQGTNDLSNKATLNLSGGYLIGNRAGNVIYNNAGNTLNISGGVITNGKAQIGAGIYNDGLNNGTSNGGTINLTGGIITGNEVEDDATDLDHDKGRYSGAGIYMKSGTLNISGNAYITNNRKSEGSSNATHFSVHGGGGVAADNDSQVNMSGGYVTGNYSNEAGGGLYIGYYTQSGNAKLTLTGGTIASNVAQTGEGGGIRIGGAGRGTIRAASKNHPIYITNNKTNTGDNNNQTGDWGGGGIFVQQNGQLNLMNVIITANTADGFGAGLSACPTGNTDIATDQGAAIYKNTAKGEHYSRGSGTKNEDKDAYDFYQNNPHTYQDYFLAHDKNTPAYSVTNGMLGGGSEEYKGTFNNNNSYEEEYNSSKFIGLSANPSDDDVKKALDLASTYISGNHSHNHGGGIMTNGIVTLGESQEVFPALKLNAYKAFRLKATNGSVAKKLAMNTNQFKFEIFQHTGDKTIQPEWNGTEFTRTSGTNSLVSEFGNEDAAAGSLGKIESNIPNFLYNEAGSYTFYLVEEDNEDTMITYDHSVYVIQFDVVPVPARKKMVNNVEIVPYEINDLSVSKVVEGKSTPLNSGGYSYDSESSVVTLYSSSQAAFTNTEQSYDFSLTKTDQDKPDRNLSGAEFTLYQLASNYHDKSVNTIDISQYATKTTDKDGKAVFQSLQRDHLYYLKETKAPEQYETSGPWIIEITGSGSAKIYDADCTESSDESGNLKTLTRNNSSKTFMKGEGATLTTSKNNVNVFETTISDPSIKYTMPNTGGHGTNFYYQVGILLITLVNIVWIIKRRVV